jgi:RNA polymerase sigma factor (sigma-70 family)
VTATEPATRDDTPVLTDAQRAVVEDNFGLVGFTISRYFPHLAGDPDAFQDGVLGLMRAALDYDPARARISTYAVPWIRQALGRGQERRMGKNYRAARYRGEEYTPPLSLDSLVAGDGDDGLPLEGKVTAEVPDPADQVAERLDATLLARRVWGACRDELRDDLDRDAARRLVDMVAGRDPDTVELIAFRHGRSRRAVRQRSDRLRSVIRDEITRGTG